MLLKLIDIHLRGAKRERLKNINMTITHGEKIALLGKSGAGKSSLISVANGSLKPDKGNVELNGKMISKSSRSERRLISTLWQDLRLIEELNVSQNINSGALGRKNIIWAIKNLISNTESKLCLNCIEAVGLNEEFLDKQIRNLSGGQKQRVAIARTLRQECEILLADEPLVSLDPYLTNEILELLLNKRKNTKVVVPNTTLISLHRPDLINNFTRVIGLKNGQIVLDQPLGDISSSLINGLYD